MGKLIIIGKDDKRIMSFEEVLELYTPLIKSEIQRFRNLKMEYDDKYQVATVALWHMYIKYNSETMVGFGHLAKKAIQNDLIHQITYSNRSKRSGLEVVYADRTIKLSNGTDMSIMDTIEGDTNVENDMILKSCMNKFMNKISQKQKETISLYVAGKKYKEISKILGIAETTISMRMTAAKKIFIQSMAI